MGRWLFGGTTRTSEGRGEHLCHTLSRYLLQRFDPYTPSRLGGEGLEQGSEGERRAKFHA